MKKLTNIKNVKEIISKHGFKFSKGLGQNFIIDETVCPKMAQAACSDGADGVIEIGPGIGTLTVELAKTFKKVVAVEIDSRLIPVLGENLSEFENVEVINADVLKTNLNEIIDTKFKGCSKVAVCANLPYYITSEIIMYILENEFEKIENIVVMVQKEAAQRICAMPGTRTAGTISLGVRYFGEPEILFNVSKGCFIPSPKVDSSVIKIKPNREFSMKVKDKKMFFKVVRAAYAQRRKTLLNSLSSGLGLSKEYLSDVIRETGLDISLRAENLSFEQFVMLSNQLAI